MRARSTQSPADRCRPPGAGGFAILMVVTMLAFIVLLLVGLAAYTQVETAVSGNTQRQAQARENALLGLNVALGQLQRHVGPDTRITAPAEAFQYRTGTRRYSGVWPADGQEDDDGDPLTPLTWLVSGNEARDSQGNATPRAVTPETALNANTAAQLVGPNTSRTNNDVLARLVPITAPSVPGMPVNSNTPIGRYAWWVGDQGVKAPVALNDRAVSPETSAQITYPPYDTKELLRRIRQQIALGPGPATSAGASVFEPRNHSSGSTPRNADLVTNVVAPSQVAFLKNSAGNALGLVTAQSNFHAWSPDNLAVLADSRAGGLRRDLSLRPDLLGSAFEAWTNYPAYMEDPLAPSTLAAVPEIGSLEALRRRYRITPSLPDGPLTHRIAPVLSLCLLNFDSGTVNQATDVAPLESRLRWIIGLWNPYSSALVPEDLRVEIYNLPEVLEFAAGPNDPTLATIYPRAMFGHPLRLSLPWDATRADLLDANGDPIPDVASWLPGRVYYWASEGNSVEPPDGNRGHFYSKSLIRPSQSSIVERAAIDSSGAPVQIDGSLSGGWRSPDSTPLVVQLFRKNDTTPLATYTSPTFAPFFATDPGSTSQAASGGYEFSFLFRLNSRAAADWLGAAGRDPRGETLPDTAYEPGPVGPPPAYQGLAAITNDDLLLERSMGASGRSYNEDVPVFELPRSPLLSAGSLQHLHFPAARPFVVGNPWGATEEILPNLPANRIFDRHFFSGLAAPVTAAATAALDERLAVPLPNPLLKVLSRKTDGRAVVLRDLLGVAAGSADPSAGFSSKHLLQRGSFNLNSTNNLAWLAVLRGTRYTNSETFQYLDSSSVTGTNTDSPVAAIAPVGAVFFRFPQSAQETFKASEPTMVDTGSGFVLSTYAASDTEPPAAPNVLSAANTHLFRRGMRVLSAADTVAFANAIAARVLEKHRESGPFVSVEDFLAPRVLYADPSGGERSLLETAIADANLNSSVAEFSSQWLTPADVMTALAPFLFARSDTFIIRAYGEALNPATSTVEGRAWCEALVQRMPEWVDKTQPEETAPADLNDLNRSLGRRFQVVSFRWLTRADI